MFPQKGKFKLHQIILFFFFFQVVYHTPPRFPLDVINKIREGASILFKKLGLRDFARIDGWFLPPSAAMSASEANDFGKTESGTVIFTDINLVVILFIPFYN